MAQRWNQPFYLQPEALKANIPKLGIWKRDLGRTVSHTMPDAPPIMSAKRSAWTVAGKDVNVGL